MHTIDIMSYKDFDFEVDGHTASLEDIFPGYNENDRIGVVVGRPGGGWEQVPCSCQHLLDSMIFIARV